MKKLIIIIFLFHIFNFSYSQNDNNNAFNEKFKELVFTQIFENIEVNIPLFIVVPGFIMFSNIQYINNNILFNENISEDDSFSKLSDYSENELINIFNCVFIPPVPLNSNIQLRARLKDKILYELILERDKNYDILKLSLPDKSYKKEAKYLDGQLKTLTINKNGEIDFYKIENLNDSIVIKTKYNTSSQKYSIKKIIFHNNVPITKYYYHKSKNRQNKKIKKIIQYEYNPDGKLQVKKICNKNGVVRDSILYFYKDDLLSAVIKRYSNKQSTIFYKYKGNLVTKKSIISNDLCVDMEYVYDTNNRIETFQISKPRNNFIQKYLFTYNTDKKLISVKNYSINKNNYKTNLNSQYIFNYINNQILKSVIVTDKKGNITKEILYQIEYINKD